MYRYSPFEQKTWYISRAQFAFFAVAFYHRGVLRYLLFDYHSMLGVRGVHKSATKIQMIIRVEGYVPGTMQSSCLPQRASYASPTRYILVPAAWIAWVYNIESVNSVWMRLINLSLKERHDEKGQRHQMQVANRLIESVTDERVVASNEYCATKRPTMRSAAHRVNTFVASADMSWAIHVASVVRIDETRVYLTVCLYFSLSMRPERLAASMLTPLVV